jgi:hypothetical protein
VLLIAAGSFSSCAQLDDLRKDTSNADDRPVWCSLIRGGVWVERVICRINVSGATIQNGPEIRNRPSTATNPINFLSMLVLFGGTAKCAAQHLNGHHHTQKKK